jgi:hypothetical protein
VSTWSQQIREQERAEPLPDTGRAKWGPLVASTDVDDAVVAVLREWLPTHLRRETEYRGLDFPLTPPRQYDTALVPDELLDNMLPACVAETATMQATAGGVARTYQGEWQTMVYNVVRGKRGRFTRRLASLYEAATRRCLVQHRPGVPLDWIHYQGMRLEQIPGDRTGGRYLLAGVSIFRVRTHAIVDPDARPDLPDRDDYRPWPDVVTADVEVVKEPRA